jgi:hypothetical protein
MPSYAPSSPPPVTMGDDAGRRWLCRARGVELLLEPRPEGVGVRAKDGRRGVGRG